MTTTRLWRSLRSILPLFKYSIHAFLRNSTDSVQTLAKLAEAGQARAVVTWRCCRLLTRYRDCLKQFAQNIFLLRWYTLSEPLQKDCLCPPQRQRNCIIYGLSVAKHWVQSEFWAILCIRMVSTVKTGDPGDHHTAWGHKNTQTDVACGQRNSGALLV